MPQSPAPASHGSSELTRQASGGPHQPPQTPTPVKPGNGIDNLEQGVTLKELKDFLRNCEKEEAQAWRSLVNPPKRQSQHDDSSIVIDEIDQYRRRVTDVWRRISDDCEVLRSRVKTLEDEDLKTSKDKDVTNLGDKDTIGAPPCEMPYAGLME